MAIQVYNYLPQNIKQIQTTIQFKSRVKIFSLNKCQYTLKEYLHIK